jgi:hypothetical protein
MSRKVGEITCGIIFGSLSISELILIPSMTIKVLAKNIGIRFCYQGDQNRKKNSLCGGVRILKGTSNITNLCTL